MLRSDELEWNDGVRLDSNNVWKFNLDRNRFTSGFVIKQKEVKHGKYYGR